ncbi:MAG: metal-dependent hydrolase [Candidatus Pacearchaeota archaeon]|nr:metal-dependent hydrolase [Candidatus Pacearchaeota archaeon]
MFFKTHLVIAFFFVLIFFQHIENPIIFLPVVFFATIIPDIDNRFSKIGHHKIFRIFNFFIRHRGVIHSFTFLAIISIFIFLFFKEILIPFTAAYSLHLILDGFTKKGIKPLYPLKKEMKWKIKTGGIIETVLFIIFFLVDLLLIAKKFNVL